MFNSDKQRERILKIIYFHLKANIPHEKIDIKHSYLSAQRITIHSLNKSLRSQIYFGISTHILKIVTFIVKDGRCIGTYHFPPLEDNDNLLEMVCNRLKEEME